MTQLRDRTVVVTGGASGIGLEIGRAALARGARVVLADIDPQRLATAVDDVSGEGSEVVGLRVDVTDEASVAELAVAARSAFGSVDVVFNNAGIWTFGRQWEMSSEEWRRIVEVNLWGVVHGVRAFVPLLLDNPGGGHVVNTASTAGLVGGAHRGAYAATKHAVIGLSQSLRAELRAADSTVRVSVVCPGKIDTAIFGDLADAPDGLAAAAAAILAAPSVPAPEAARTILDGVEAEAFWILPGAAAARRGVEKELTRLLEAFDSPFAT